MVSRDYSGEILVFVPNKIRISHPVKLYGDGAVKNYIGVSIRNGNNHKIRSVKRD